METSYFINVFFFSYIALIGETVISNAFMLNPMFGNMCLVTSYVGHDNVVNSVINYDSKFLLPLLVESYKSLMPFAIEVLQMLPRQMDFKHLFHTTETNPNTLKHIVFRLELNEF